MRKVEILLLKNEGLTLYSGTQRDSTGSRRKVMNMSKEWYLYVLECRDKSLYTGITLDLRRRIDDHRSGKGGRYTRSRLPVSLVYSESCSTRSEALKRELQVKGWTRKRKLALILQYLRSLDGEYGQTPKLKPRGPA